MEHRLGQQDPNLLAEFQSNILSQAILEVETALPYFGENGEANFQKFRGQLSTDPKQVGTGVNDRSLFKRCGDFSRELQRVMQVVGFQTTLSSSSSVSLRVEHLYLIRRLQGLDIIIDPSIGQLIIGYNQIFVGTRTQLKELVLDRTGEGKDYQYSQILFKDTPTNTFERIWGNSSRQYIAVRESMKEPSKHRLTEIDVLSKKNEYKYNKTYRIVGR